MICIQEVIDTVWLIRAIALGEKLLCLTVLAYSALYRLLEADDQM